MTRIGDEYVFSYTNDGFRMAIATQPVYETPADIINEEAAVLIFMMVLTVPHLTGRSGH